MGILDSLFSARKKDSKLRMEFIKQDNIWHVIKGYAIMYIGSEESCKNYMNNMKLATV